MFDGLCQQLSKIARWQRWSYDVFVFVVSLESVRCSTVLGHNQAEVAVKTIL